MAPTWSLAFSRNGEEYKWDVESKTRMAPRPHMEPEALAKFPGASPICPAVTGQFWKPAGSSWYTAPSWTLWRLFSDAIFGQLPLPPAGSQRVWAPVRRNRLVRKPWVGGGMGCQSSLGDSYLTAAGSRFAKGRRQGWMEVMPSADGVRSLFSSNFY